MSSTIKKSICRTYLLDKASQTRSHKYNRVSSKVYPYLEAKMREYMDNIVSTQPSKGKTISV